MISLKRYLDMDRTGTEERSDSEPDALLPATVAAYRSALAEMGACGLEVCPPLGGDLKQSMEKLGERLMGRLSLEVVEETKTGVGEQLTLWGQRTARHYRETTREVKEILLSMARAAESVGERDQRCAAQITCVTAQLKNVANLEDLTEIRASIQKSAAELKSSIDRMTAEGKAALEQLRGQVSKYQARLEEAERIASLDALTGVRSRSWVEGQLELSLHAGGALCVAILDIDGFKQVNDEHGHLVGDELLKQFATELKSASRSADILGRWGGDEFIFLMQYGLAEAKSQTDRLQKWVCGNYTVQGNCDPIKLRVEASLGLAEHLPGETMKALIDRADAEMYRQKAASRALRTAVPR
jgi:diguanylate cyclase (GGDEF)-like protein